MPALYKDITTKIIDMMKSMPSSSTRLPSERSLQDMFGVSRQTVRHALAECEEGGYILRKAGSGIYLTEAYQKQRNHIALLTPSQTEYIFPSLITCLEDAFNEQLYTLDVYETSDSISSTFDILQKIATSHISCILIYALKTAIYVPFEDLLKQIESNGTRIVFIGETYSNLSSYPCIRFDHSSFIKKIAESIYDRTKINKQSASYIALFMHDNLASYNKYHALASSLIDYNVDLDEHHFRWFSYTDYMSLEQNHYTVFQKVLDNIIDKPSIYICDNDLVAYWLIKYLKREHLLDEDTLIYSFDKSYLTKIMGTKVYSFGYDTKEIVSSVIDYWLSLPLR